MLRIVFLLELGGGVVQQSGREHAVARLRQNKSRQPAVQILGRIEHFSPAGLPEFGDLAQDLEEARLAVFAFRRKIGAGVKGLESGGEEAIERPSALAGHGLGGGHVYLVHVGPFLAVHFDADEMGVEKSGDVGVLERFPLHDVAPVAGGIADAQEDRFVLLAGAGEGLLAPREPIHRIVAGVAGGRAIFRAPGGWSLAQVNLQEKC